MKNKVKILSPFWLARQKVVREQMIPYQWEVINDLNHINIVTTNTGGDSSALDSDKSYVVENFLIAAGKKKGKRGGMVFQDSDAYKWLEAAAYTLECHADEDLKKKCDTLVDIIADAQEEDGYLNTYFTVNEPDRKYQSLYMSHELYCAGHFIEAAVAYHKVTGSKKVLDIATKLANNIDAHFGPQEGKIHGADGHEEIELALLRLYELTQEKRYLDLALYFLHIRGEDAQFFLKMMKNDVALGRKSLIQGLEILHSDFDASYFQSDKPAHEQTEANGHAVRVVYLASALALASAITKDERCTQACQNYWKNIVGKRMYITGGIGSTRHGEAFSADYDLPNDTIYGETCASVGLNFFANNMLRRDKDGMYGDVFERSLYNTVLAGMALDGKSYFYVNPLEVNPLYSKKNPGLSHVLTRRPGWFACACCPPNLARMVMSLGHYVYQVADDTTFVNLYLASEGELEVKGQDFCITQESDYPWCGKVTIKVGKGKSKLALRIPAWSQKQDIMVNGDKAKGEIRKGFFYLAHEVKDGDEITLNLHMHAQYMMANPNIAADYDKLALERGPIVYCVEEYDNGPHLHSLSLSGQKEISESFNKDLLGGVTTLSVTDEQDEVSTRDTLTLYAPYCKAQTKSKTLLFIPYFAWCNREEGEMRVWLHRH